MEHITLLADLFHNIPGQMRRAAETHGDFQYVLDELWQKRPDFGHPWLEAAVRHHRIDRSSDLLRSWQ
jgi:hypothetical protein